MRQIRTLSEHRLARLSKRAGLWLVWLGAVLAFVTTFAPLTREARREMHRQLDSMTQLVIALITIRAAKRVRQLTPAIGGKPTRAAERSSDRRAIAGSALRRNLRGRDVRDRIQALAAMLRDPEPAIRAMLRRLRKGGLTRRTFSILPTRLCDEIFSQAMAALQRHHDTS